MKFKTGDIVLWYNQWYEIRKVSASNRNVLGISLTGSGVQISRSDLRCYPKALDEDDLGKRYYLFTDPEHEFRRSTILRDGRIIRK